MRLIDADEYPCNKCGVEYCYQNCKEFRDWFNTTVEAEPVRHGKWEGYHGEKFCKDGEYRHYHFYVCNNCGRRTAVTSKYCPDCGCLMDGD